MVYGMSRKPKTVSVTSIAAELGISPSAVSRAINNRAGVSETVRTRVAGLLEKYHFRPAYPASRLPRIAVVSGRGEVSPYLAGVLSGIYRYVQKGTLSATAVIHPTLETGKLLDLIRDQQPALRMDEGGTPMRQAIPARHSAQSPERSAGVMPGMSNETRHASALSE